MNRRLRSLALIAFLLAAQHGARPADPAVESRELPRVPPTEPDKALGTFQIKKGFQIQLTAAEPLVVDPIAISFDENGRLFVVEMRDYSERRNESPHLGRIRMLEDIDGDGRFDKSTVYVDNLPWPTAVTCYDGGVFIGVTPDILYCKDTNGDGVADVREVVFTGFASDYAPYQTNRLNVQAMLNSFNWGIDNRIHGAASLSGGQVQRVDTPFTREWIRLTTGVSPPSTPGSKRDLRGRDFSFDPRTLEIRTESGGGQHGMSFDSRGRKFVCSNSDHIQLVMYDDRYASRSSGYELPPARVSIAADGPAAEVFRISPDEPWRVIRTKWRVSGLVQGLVEGGGRPSGYFTGATGTTIYRGDAFPEEYRENAFVADCGSNLVHRKRLSPDKDGVGLIARRPDDEQKTEFLASTDNWFRPVQFANAPDGCLHLADMYREVIEHPWSIPDSIKQHLDLNSGGDRGRIYRIVPDGFTQPKPPHLSAATTKELVALLESRNGWHGDTAARLLYERQDTTAAPVLETLLKNSTSPIAKVRVLYVLKGIQALTKAHVLAAFGDRADLVRLQAVRLTEDLELQTDGRVQQELARLSTDPSPLVRYQVCLTLGSGFQGREKATALANLALQDSQNRWIRGAVLGSLNQEAPAVFEQLVADKGFRGSTNGQSFLCEVARVVAAGGDTNAIAIVLNHAGNAGEPALAFGLVNSLSESLLRSGGSLSSVDIQGKLGAIGAAAKEVASNTTAPEADRVAAISLLATVAAGDSRATLLSLLAADRSNAVRSAALAGLGRIGDAGMAEELLGRWSQLTPQLQRGALSLFLTRTDGTKVLLEAVERGAVSRTDLSASQLQTLRTHPDNGVRQRTSELFGQPPTAGRLEVVSSFVPALSLAGNAERGKAIYQERCASCHRLGGQGSALGPDLATVKSGGRESILVNILDPNRQVTPNYQNYTIETKDGQTLSGIIVSESATSVTLRGPNGAENVVPRSNLDRMRSDGRSIMPEGLEAGLKSQDLADLLAWITTAE